ncbi:Endoribonuclease YBEY, chloroplastic [Seminavis robusta]|uniref:Endoribonuclease YBEY, chloroplastic n=1 Tax=Seminavis robusta TaxID=568900 RepID=A0A9N8E951_9STRA|nr:Endoribonuclease YBEY, chloroplastic [Seminavis robusta]|eukprot:Sro630_g178320.1 Endoribonuclease YBEY, chloroplastic (452) ;mRNA; f:19125-20480
MASTRRAAGFLANMGSSHRRNVIKGRQTMATLSIPVYGGLARGGSSSSDEDNKVDPDIPFRMPPPNNGFGNTPNKAEVYANDELWDLLQIHEGLSDQMNQRQQDTKSSAVLPGKDPGAPSLHDLVLQTVQEMDDTASRDSANQANQEEDKDDDSSIARAKDSIIAIASDVDGTLLSSKQRVHPRTEAAIRKAVSQVDSSNNANDSGHKKLQYFFPATGKTRKGALDSLGPEIRELLSQLPGVFIQGLYCIDSNGNVLFEQKLTAAAVEKAEILAEKHGVTLLGYDGDSLYSNKGGDPTLCAEIHEKWGEPKPTSISSLAEHANGLHKILFVLQDKATLTNTVRPDLEAMANENDATVTQAIPTMLELLPQGCSKALGVQKLCQSLGIDPGTQLLAIGDAENDIGMLEMAAIGVAVGNACGMAREAADYVMDETNDEGGAGAAMEKFSPLGR